MVSSMLLFCMRCCVNFRVCCCVILTRTTGSIKLSFLEIVRFLSGTIWWVIFWGVFKTSFSSLVFNLQFLDFTYLQTWDAPARVREYPIKLFKVESLGLGLRFWGPNSHRPSQNPIFGGGAPDKTPFGTRLKPFLVPLFSVHIFTVCGRRAHSSTTGYSHHCGLI